MIPGPAAVARACCVSDETRGPRSFPLYCTLARVLHGSSLHTHVELALCPCFARTRFIPVTLHFQWRYLSQNPASNLHAISPRETARAGTGTDEIR